MDVAEESTQLKIQDLVRVTPIPQRGDHLHGAVCVCGSTQVHLGPMETTLLGGFSKTVNHTWEKATCGSCGLVFTRETKHGFVWYTKDKFVLSGMPACFESYIYLCAKCADGRVRRRYEDLSGRPTDCLCSTRAADGTMVKQYKTFYECDTCGSGGMMAHEYWTPPSPF
jgi:hypothetical protein